MKNLMLACVLATVPAWLSAVTEVVYEAANPQTSYADGAVTITYDGGLIRAVTFDPAKADGVSMSGDPLALTACATVSCSSVGAVTLANDLTSSEAGTLAFLNASELQQTGTIDLASGSTIAIENIHEAVPCQWKRANDIHVNKNTCEWVTLWENTSLSILTNMTGQMAGSVFGGIVKTTSWFFENDGATATCQLQYGSTSMLRGLVYLFRQNGNNVEIQTRYRTYYWPKKDVSGLPVPKEGEKDFRLSENRWAYGQEDETSYGWTSLYGTNLVFHCSDTPGGLKTSVTFNGSNATQNCTMRVGNGTSPAEAIMLHAMSFPVNGQVLVKGGSILEHSIPHKLDPTTGQVRGCNFTVEAGGLLHTKDIYTFSATETDITLNGGTLQLREVSAGYDDSDTSFHRLYLNDGARLTGWAPRMRAADGLFQVRGNKASVCETGIILWSANAGVPGQVTFDVDDVTGDGDVDLYVEKSIRLTDTTAGDAYRKVSIVKTGAGTMRIDAKLQMTNGVDSLTYLNEGTLLVNGSSCLHPGCNFVFNGGTLAFSENSANTSQTVKVGARGGTIAPGSGATIAFADSSSVAWEAGDSLVIDCDCTAKQVRFGTSARALTLAQRRRLVSTSGQRLTLDADGYVVPTRGTILLFR